MPLWVRGEVTTSDFANLPTLSRFTRPCSCHLCEVCLSTCMLTLSQMKEVEHPVLGSDGYWYDGACLQRWIREGNKRDIIPGKELVSVRGIFASFNSHHARRIRERVVLSLNHYLGVGSRVVRTTTPIKLEQTLHRRFPLPSVRRSALYKPPSGPKLILSNHPCSSFRRVPSPRRSLPLFLKACKVVVREEEKKMGRGAREAGLLSHLPEGW